MTHSSTSAAVSMRNKFSSGFKFLGILLLVLLLSGKSWAAPATATYAIATVSTVNTTGTAPSGSSATYSQTFATKSQMASGDNTVLTLTGYAGYKITSIVLSMKSNGSAGSGSLSVVAGTTTISSVATTTFSNANWNGSYSSAYTNITKTPTAYTIGAGENVVITIAATVNSLYIQSYAITYDLASGAPSLSSPTVTVTSPNAATLGANLTSTGTSSITASGTAYKTTAGVAATDNAATGGPTGTGAYTQSRSGFNAQSQYFFVGYATNGSGTSLSPESSFYTFSNPPTAQPSSFSTTAGSSSLAVGWSSASYPASGATKAGYLLLYSTGTPSLIASPNGVAPAIAISVGTQVAVTETTLPTTPTTSASISSLLNGTTYNLLIVPYTWDGANAGTYNYLTSSALTTTGQPTAVNYTWNGGASGSWTTPGNWLPATSVSGPATGDAVTFNSGSSISIATSLPTTVALSSITISNSGTIVTLGPSSSASSTITLTNSVTALSIANGTTLNLIGNTTNSRNITLAFSGSGNTATIAGTLNLQASGSGAGNYTATNSTTTVSGTMTSNTSLTTVSSTASNLIFSSTGKFQLTGTSANTVPTATWNAGSLVQLSQSGSTTITMAGLSNQTFSNFTIDATHNGTINFNTTSSDISFTVNGDYTQSGTPTIELASGTGTTNITVGGAFQKTAGIITTTNTSAYNGLITLNNTSGKNFQSNSSKYVDFTIATNAKYTLNGALAASAFASAIIVNGTLDCSTNLVTGASNSFSLASGATLKFADVNGITTTGATGAIQVGGARTFNAGANYTYNGSLGQVTGTGLPASLTGTVTISNSAGVTLSQNTAFTGVGALSLSSGKLTTNGKTLTLINSTTGSTNSYIVADATGTVTMSAVTSAKTLPIGTSTSYAPLVITASGTAYTTYVTTSLPLTPFAASKAVGLAWSIGGTAPSSVKFQWNGSDQGASFVSGGTCEMGRYTNPTYTITALSSAAGTDPNSITASSGFLTGTNFYVIGNTNAVRLDAPTITTTIGASVITNNSASSGGQTIAGASLTAEGVVWDTNTTPTVALSTRTNDGTSTSNFVSSLSSLSAQTLYYARAYVTNANNTGYGGQITFRTLSNPATVQASSLAANATSTSNIDLNWTAATFPVSGATVTGYLLYRASGANTASFAGVNGAVPTAGSNTTLVATLTGSDVSYSNGSLTYTTAYNYLLIPFTWDGANASTYNYLTASAPTASATTASPATPLISASGTLTARTTTYGTASSVTSFSVSGVTMNEGILITPPAGFEVSSTSDFSSNVGNASSPITVGSTGTISTTTIYVRLKATAFAGSYSGNIVLTSNGADPVNMATASSTVSPYPLTVGGLFGVNKIYDGTTSASITGTAVLSATVNSDVISLDGSPTTVAFVTADAGNPKTINISGFSISGTNSASYSLTAPTTTAIITAKALTMTGLSVLGGSKVYDGTTSAAVTGAPALASSEVKGSGTTSDGIPYTGDIVSITGTPVGTYNDANVASASSVTFSGLSLTGANAGNYSLTIQSPASATITKASQTITGVSGTASKYVGDTYTIVATSATSGLNPIFYSSSSTGVASVDASGLVTAITAGSTTITVSQSASSNYNATTATQSLTVNTTPIVLAGWDVNGQSNYGTSPLSATTANTNITVGGFTRGSGVTTSGTASAKAWGGNGWSQTDAATGVTANQFVTFTLMPNSGYKLNLSSISKFDYRRSSGGSPYGLLQYQINSGSFVDISTLSFSSSAGAGSSLSAIDLSTVSGLQSLTNSSTVTFRIVPYGGTSATGTWYVYDVSNTTADDFTISGSITPIYSIGVSSNDVTKGTVSGGGTKDAGTSVSLTATPISGSYRFVNWTDGSGTFVSVANPYAFSASADKTLVANFSDFTTTISSAVNASTIADCATCDVTVASTGILTVDAAKTYKSLTIAAGGKVTLNNSTALTVTGNLTLQSGASGTGTFVDKNASGNLNVQGTTSVEQFLTGGRNWYLSSPVTGANATTVLGTSTATVKPTSFVWYDETKGAGSPWTPETSTLIVGKGYIATNPASPATQTTDGVITFSGTLNTGNYSTATQNALTLSSTGVKDGFNLVGNPYPSYLDWNQATKTNLNATMWYRTKEVGGYKFYTYNGTAAAYGGGEIGVPANVSNLIPPMQAFWVRVQGGSGTLAFTNNMRSHLVGTNPIKAPAASKSTQQVLRLHVSNSINTDETVVYFNPNASDAFDAFDSPKMTNGNAAIPEIYTVAGTEQLVINGLKTLPSVLELPLGFTTGQSNTFTIKASEISNFAADTRIYLVDKVLNTDQELTADAAYSFTSDKVSTTDRFALIFKTPSITDGLNAVDEGSFWISGNSANEIIVHGLSDAKTTVEIYNEVGQKLVSNTLMAANKALRTPRLVPGVYMVTVSSEGKKITRKVILK